MTFEPSERARGAYTRPGEPLRGAERVEWARIALEDAVERMVKNPDEPVYRIAVASRYRELDVVRGAIERQAEARITQGAENARAPNQAPLILCQNCRRTIALVGQHEAAPNIFVCAPRGAGLGVSR